VAPTFPANGDVNPYSVTLVPPTNGRLHRGHVLVGNFNNQANLQGTGTTIVDVAPNGAVSLFAQVGRSNGYFWLATAITRCQPNLLELCTTAAMVSPMPLGVRKPPMHESAGPRRWGWKRDLRGTLSRNFVGLQTPPRWLAVADFLKFGTKQELLWVQCHPSLLSIITFGFDNQPARQA
jgi:hypothetical protein